MIDVLLFSIGYMVSAACFVWIGWSLCERKHVNRNIKALEESIRIKKKLEEQLLYYYGNFAIDDTIQSVEKDGKAEAVYLGALKDDH